MKKTLSFRMIYNRSFSCFENIFDHFFFIFKSKILKSNYVYKYGWFFFGGGAGGGG